MKRLMMGAMLLTALTPGLWADDEEKKPAPAEQQYQALEKEYDDAVAAFRKAYQAAETSAEKQKVVQEQMPRGDKYAGKFLALAEKYPKGKTAAKALLWVVAHANGNGGGDLRGKAITLLLRDHLEGADFSAMTLARLANADDADSGKLLRALVDKNPNEEVKGHATFALAQYLYGQAQTAQRVQKSPKMREAYEEHLGKEAVKALLLESPTRLSAGAEDLFQRVVDQYADLKAAYGDPPPTLGKQAKGFLFEMRDLAIDKKAPEVVGKGLDGKEVKLSDYKGKVVVLDIWATWCGPCRAMIPHERELVKRLKDKPFVLVSISADDEKETLTNFLKKEPMPWTHWHNGAEGGIIEAWNVRYYPTIYVLDGKGVIRYRDVRGEEMDEAVGTLLRELK